jgi:hypothetical protein
MANNVWVLSDSPMVEHMISCEEPNAKQLLFYLMETLPHDQFTRLTVTLWGYGQQDVRRFMRRFIKTLYLSMDLSIAFFSSIKSALLLKV